MRERSTFENEVQNLEVYSNISGDLWPKRDPNDKGTKRSGRNVKYVPSHNNVRWLNDGSMAMLSMCDAFCKSSKFIYIIVSYFSPGIILVRDNFYDYFRNTYSNLIEEVTKLNKQNGVKNANTIPLISLLSVKSRQIPVRIVMFQPGKLQKHFGGYGGWHDAYKMVRRWSDKIDIQLAKWGGKYEGYLMGGHHQKSSIVGTNSGLIGFCGGLDLAFGRWAYSSHDLYKDPIDLPSRIDPVLKVKDQMP